MTMKHIVIGRFTAYQLQKVSLFLWGMYDLLQRKLLNLWHSANCYLRRTKKLVHQFNVMLFCCSILDFESENMTKLRL